VVIINWRVTRRIGKKHKNIQERLGKKRKGTIHRGKRELRVTLYAKRPKTGTGIGREEKRRKVQSGKYILAIHRANIHAVDEEKPDNLHYIRD